MLVQRPENVGGSDEWDLCKIRRSENYEDGYGNDGTRVLQESTPKSSGGFMRIERAEIENICGENSDCDKSKQVGSINISRISSQPGAKMNRRRPWLG